MRKEVVDLVQFYRKESIGHITAQEIKRRLASDLPVLLEGKV